MKKRILINNFFAPVLSRGIPIYAKNLEAVFSSIGAECQVITCPRSLAQLDRRILNILFVLYEQVLIPSLGLFYDATIYPYNSVSVVSSVSKRSLLVIHDFIPNKKNTRSLPSLYIKITQKIYSIFRGDVAYVSATTRKVATRARMFPHSRSFDLTNSFSSFRAKADAMQQSDGGYVLLCSGWGDNKDLPRALELYTKSGLQNMLPLRILGLGRNSSLLHAIAQRYSLSVSNICALAELSDENVITEYKNSSFVWVHSRREGFGRPIAEARICGKQVIASDILPFREQAGDGVLFYRGLEEFQAGISVCIERLHSSAATVPVYKDKLVEQARHFLSCR